MNDTEVCSFAMDIIEIIRKDLNNSIYNEPTANLQVKWHKGNSLNASATCKSKILEPAQHIISISYNLVIEIYENINDFCNYIESDFDKKMFDTFFANHTPYDSLLPTLFSPKDYRKNMFIGALTWIFFHELAHLNQGHGHFIKNTIDQKELAIYEEYKFNDFSNLQGQESAIYHVLELSADFEAIQRCVIELIRHFQGDELEESIITLVCGISCSIYKFHKLTTPNFQIVLKGRHPAPIVRLEQIMPQIWELLDILQKSNQFCFHLNRQDLVYLCDRSAVMVGLFWFRKERINPSNLSGWLYGSTLERPEGRDYLKNIVNTWDLIKPLLEEYKRLDKTFSLLNFTKEYRTLIF